MARRNPDPAAPSRRGGRLGCLRKPYGAALLLGVVALAQAGIGLGLTAGSGTATPDLTLASDADGSALFAASGLAPGHPVTRCLRLSYGNAVAGDQLQLISTSSGTLASRMHVRVEAGSGGSAASCTGFTGSVVYSGTLAALTAAHGTAPTALPLKTLADGSSAMTVRLQVSVDDTNAAQGTSASSDLVWVANALGDRTPPPPVVTPVDPTPPVTTPPVAPPPATTPPVVTPPVVTPPTTPAVPPVADPPADAPSAADPAPTSPSIPDSSSSVSDGSPVQPTAAPSAPAATATTPPVDTTGGVPTGTDASPAPGAAAGSGKSSGGGGGIAGVGHVFSSGARAVSSGARAVATAAGNLAHAVRTQVIAPVAVAAAPAVRGASLGLGGTAPLLGMFLLIQGRIDRRDPKLALAPAYADPDLTFNDIPRGPLKSRPTSLPAESEPGSEQ